MFEFMFIILIIFGFAFGFVVCNDHKRFVLKHSNRLIELNRINEKYNFHNIDNIEYKVKYDNDNFYESVSTLDYLIYQLVYDKNKVKTEIGKTIDNLNNFELYKNEVNNIEIIEEYNCESKNMFKFLLNYYLKKLFNKSVKYPQVNFNITVTIVKTNIQDRFLERKYYTFGIEEIEEILNDLDDKTGNRYNIDYVWNAISIVERAKISNKLRFYLYDKAGNRCQKCGRHESQTNLEIDHIIPISKGGKSNIDNLQVLCHECNVRKSDFIENVPNGFYYDKEKCPKCGAPLRVVNGKNGKFYGCMNYPKCNYTKPYNTKSN